MTTEELELENEKYFDLLVRVDKEAKLPPDLAMAIDEAISYKPRLAS